MLHKVLAFFGAEIVQLYQSPINRAAAGGRGTARGRGLAPSFTHLLEHI
jgi:hypothetical protein